MLLAPATAVADPAVEAAPTPAVDAAPPTALRNARDPLAGVRTGGLPPDGGADSAIFDALAADGFRVYIDLRTEQEGLETARAAAEAAGLAYVSIPVGDESDLDLGSVRALDAVLDDAGRGPAVVACASGNRSGALLALRAFWLEGMPAEEALELGRRAGLSRFEPQVRELLGLGPLPPAEPTPPAAPEASADQAPASPPS